MDICLHGHLFIKHTYKQHWFSHLIFMNASVVKQMHLATPSTD